VAISGGARVIRLIPDNVLVSDSVLVSDKSVSDSSSGEPSQYHIDVEVRLPVDSPTSCTIGTLVNVHTQLPVRCTQVCIWK
jgi:hypothetical protein